METEKLHCIICDKDFDKSQTRIENLRTVPCMQDGKWICGRCTGNGWKFSEIYKKPFNVNEIDYSCFFIETNLYDLPEKYFEFFNLLISIYSKNYYVGKDRFCSSKEYNLYFWINEIKPYFNLLQDDSEESNDLRRPLPGNKPIKRFSKEELIELQKYVDDKIKYMKNDL